VAAMNMRARNLYIALIAGVVLLASIQTSVHEDEYDARDPPEPWACVAGGQRVWKVFCARFWTELWEDDDTAPPGSYWSCADVKNSKDCKLIKP
jgi:hypothetical protein